MNESHGSTPNRVANGVVPRVLSVCVVLLSACGGATPANGAKDANADSKSVVASAATHISACTLMPKEDISRITSEVFTTAESNDDSKSSESSCHYTTSTNPAGISLNINWITPRDYSNAAEHAAMQKAMIGGAKLGGSLITQTLGGASMPGLRSGPVEGIGDEATQNLLLLTARKGDYSIMVQIYPTDMMKLMTDSTFVQSVLAKEKEIARQVLTKL